jgi:hypothetical protein
MHYNAWEAEVGSPRPHSATKSRLFHAHSLVRPPAEPFPRPGRSTSAPARAANVNDGALAPPQGSSLTGASTTASSRRRGRGGRDIIADVIYPARKPSKMRAPADGESAWPHNSGDTAGARRPGDRVKALQTYFAANAQAGNGTQREWRSGVNPQQLCGDEETRPRTGAKSFRRL